VLTNVKGSVTYERSGRESSLVPAASIAMASEDWTTTGGESQARVTLPDSSRVLIASDTRVQLTRFDRSDIAHASFVVDHGRVRFTVEHPQGTRADYVFTTPTASVAVRGTEGDLGFDGEQLTINVYNTKATDAPVEVAFTAGAQAGKTIVLFAGQSLVLKLVNGLLQAQVSRVGDTAMAQFAELGVPTSVQLATDDAMNRVRAMLPTPPPVPRIPGLPAIPGFPH
jgi:ferric-dicitrate binding protein FerR (iron transport regulator)